MELMDDSEDEEEDAGKPKAGSGPGTPVRNQVGLFPKSLILQSRYKQEHS